MFKQNGFGLPNTENVFYVYLNECDIVQTYLVPSVSLHRKADSGSDGCGFAAVRDNFGWAEGHCHMN